MVKSIPASKPMCNKRIIQSLSLKLANKIKLLLWAKAKLCKKKSVFKLFSKHSRK